MTLYFLTLNPFKIAETKGYAASRDVEAHYGVTLSYVTHEVQEILHPDVDVIVRRKAVEAYAYMRHPCVVEHGGLFMDALPGLPGGVGKIVWNAVGERMCDFLRPEDTRGAVARSYLGYCDGKRVRVYLGETRGRVAAGARGEYAFAWDPIFLPEGSTETYGEMGPERKRATSPLIKAWDGFFEGERPQLARIG